MLPESSEAKEIRLYPANEFPRGWEKVQAVAKGTYTDPTIVEHYGYWWIFARGDPRFNADLRRFCSKSLRGEWSEHPMSPVVRSNADLARPWGVVVREAGKRFRVAQDCWPKYGASLSAVEIIEMTTKRYSESRTPTPLFRGARESWNDNGVHQLFTAQLPDGSWLGAVDGMHTRRYFGWHCRAQSLTGAPSFLNRE
jgi:hypothetical protein